MLKEFGTKQNVKLSHVMVKAKEEVAATKPAKPRRRRGSSGGGGGTGAGVVREESDRSLAKLCSHLSVHDTSDAHLHMHCNHRLAPNLL